MKILKKILRIVLAALGNYFSKDQVIYIIEDAAWVVRKEGENLVLFLNRENIKMRITISHLGARNKIVHFGSINTYLSKNGPKNIHPSNKIIVTWYHSEEKDERLKLAKTIASSVDYIHTSCELTKKLLVAHGVSPEKIKIVHIPVDLKIFQSHPELRSIIREKYNIPNYKFVIGSFQKDGNGWGEGLSPKWIKGPDIFCDVIEKLKEKISVHVLLSGPSRGYVKERLKKMNVTFSHVYFENPDDVCELYHALDLYLLTARVEGGPKSLMESWASRIPLVSTKVGMVIDYARDGHNSLLSESENSFNLASLVLKVFQDDLFKNKICDQAMLDVKELSYEKAAIKYRDIYNILSK